MIGTARPGRCRAILERAGAAAHCRSCHRSAKYERCRRRVQYACPASERADVARDGTRGGSALATTYLIWKLALSLALSLMTLAKAFGTD